MLAVKGDIRQRVQDVEATAPREHRERQRAQHPPRPAPRTGHREISTHRRDGHAEPQGEVREAREALGVAVEEHPAECDRREREAERAQRPRRDHKEQRRDDHGDPGLAYRQHATRNLAQLRPRILRVVLAIHDAVEPHRREPRRRERQHHPAELRPRHLVVVRRQHHADQRERQCEHRVRQLHKAGVGGQSRRARERLALAQLPPVAHRGAHAGAIPSAGHIASTAAFVASSIRITGGHSRVNPSSGSFRVASIPIFEPYVNARLE